MKGRKKTLLKERESEVRIIGGYPHELHAVFRTKKEAKEYVKNPLFKKLYYYRIMKTRTGWWGVYVIEKV